jgi:hypothetical protein
MLELPEHVGILWRWPATTRKARRLVIRRTIALALVSLIGALSCTLTLASKDHKRGPQPLGEQQRREAEQRLWDLGYWAGIVDGNFDAASRHALVAFQKVEGRPRTGVLTLNELAALRAANRPTPRHGKFVHVEIDLERQVLFLIDENGDVSRTLPVSTGNGELYTDHGQIHVARTPLGTFAVRRKINGWRVSTLGLLYYPNYLVAGFAIHGSPSIPAYPASHGCIRIPMFAAKKLSSLLPIGTRVEIYDDTEQQSARRE